MSQLTKVFSVNRIDSARPGLPRLVESIAFGAHVPDADRMTGCCACAEGA